LVIKVLWIADEEGSAFAQALDEQLSLDITRAENLFEALSYVDVNDFDAILAKLPLSDTTPEMLFEEIRGNGVRTPAVMYAPGAGLADAVRLAKLGAFQVVDEVQGAVAALLAAAERKRGHSEGLVAAGQPARPAWRQMLIGESHKIQNIAEIIRLVAPRRCTVLITGETGTGKEVVARAVHAASNRAQFEMVAVNCSALPENLLEAELFGHVKGAFTGAMANRVGRFEQANRGTLFLDEIADIPMPLQTKLLRVLQEREFQRLGSSENVHVDVRVIAATNSNLPELVRQGKFREDLYYRLNVVPIAMPALRERASDIPLLAEHFVAKVCEEEGVPRKEATDEVLSQLEAHDWPGNVRQLENAVEMAVALSGERRILYPSDFPLPARTRPAMPVGKPFIAVPDHGLDFEKIVGGIELAILEQALRKTGGNKKMAADMLRLKRTTLAAKLKSLEAAAS
jgi:DNA-binding NtrC family response regulator